MPTSKSEQPASPTSPAGDRISSVTDHPTYTHHVETSEMSELVSAIQGGIANLFQLSMIIRKLPVKDEYLKAASIPKYQVDETVDVVYVGDKYPTVKYARPWLMNRLGLATVRRRQYLWYRRDHQEKLAREIAIGFGNDGQTVGSATKATTYLPNDQEDNNVEREHHEPKGDDHSQAYQTSYAPSNLTNDTSASLRVPPLPRGPDSRRVEYGEHFQCPYCQRIQNVRDRDGWKYALHWLAKILCLTSSCSGSTFFPTYDRTSVHSSLADSTCSLVSVNGLITNFMLTEGLGRA